MILRPLFFFEDTKNTGLLIFNSLKQKKFIFNFFVNRYGKKITDSRKRAKILADNRKRHHPIEALRKVLRVEIYSHTVNIIEKISICLKMGCEESVSNDDVSIVCARKYEMVTA